MTKADLVKKVATENNLTAAQAEGAVNSVLNALKEDVFRDGNSLTIKGLGTFKKAHCAEKKARNIQTGGSVIVPAHDKLVFKMSKNFE